ncbi:sporulation membrane protein YtaF [Neobacillus cucumis]|uniref:sporulation membrane protein YtaF n=1 Tax=Neobacillus cucumis TaxID=1740721 RepID=UPI0019660080|nr:sporulation membrane protein YtaF [Neobacillus cucumis]MBM7656307.1 putative sporulation protein YtaF [Neobacillus cucumis]MED4229615.1 sporulation membrane protein YtaF [Neobacillus cucumis]
MHLLSVLLIGIASNLDNLGISVSYGLRSTKIPIFSNLIIAFVSMLCAYFSIIAGKFISVFISMRIANFTGGLILICIGIKCIVTSILEENSTSDVKVDSNYSQVITHPDLADVNDDKIISLKESIFLGFALAINCLVMGLGAGITGISPVLTTFSIGVFSFISIWCGLKLGNKICGKNIGKYSNIVAGLLLIIIGVYEMIV